MDVRRLRVLLAEKGLSQIRLASAIGISPASLSYYVQGHYQAPKEIQERIASFLKVRRESLFPQSENETTNP